MKPIATLSITTRPTGVLLYELLVGGLRGRGLGAMYSAADR